MDRKDKIIAAYRNIIKYLSEDQLVDLLIEAHLEQAEMQDFATTCFNIREGVLDKIEELQDKDTYSGSSDVDWKRGFNTALNLIKNFIEESK